ncbi:putative membrane protein [Sporocytophaga myxococcoides]|uniref:Putative membrane protein n=1 Tax=Sporocytophaga myxococcoides TaxID=153721 RepID=A0A098LKF8_9BACT|nr:VTT domain-containing protein [Sporocytophaga myxococcoides]GAL86797.1 putative membrane protein [Sporocytophaga myxococcoides]
MGPESIIEFGGFAILLALVFIETGLLIGILIPGGETLLFTAGLLSGTEVLNVPLPLLMITLTLASIAGDLTGYTIGMKTRRHLFNREDSFIFKRSYLERAKAFYRKHGPVAIILGRFFPIIRTVNPLMNGAIDQPYMRFFSLTAIGCTLYVNSILLIGFYLGKTFPFLKSYLEVILLGIVLLFVLPLLIRIRKEKKNKEG